MYLPRNVVRNNVKRMWESREGRGGEERRRYENVGLKIRETLTENTPTRL